jgi:lysozyme family protein
MSWILHKGDIPVGLFVCHKCDVRNCVNPDHLFLGTAAENQADMKRKGRSGAGEMNPRAKLKLWQVQQIKVLLKNGRPVAEIAKNLGTSVHDIKNIKYGRAWRDVQPASETSLEENSMSTFTLAFNFVMNHEDPHRTGKVTEDAGGRTRFGIAAKFHPELPESFFTGPADAALKTAEEILRRDYWEPMRLAELLDQKLANKLFDMAVNMGVHQAAVYAQRAVNGVIIGAQALNTSAPGEDSRDGTQALGSPASGGFSRDGVEVLLPATPIHEDGVIGPRTLAALNAADPAKLYALLCDWSRRHYEHIAAINPAQAKNLQGWLKRATG